MEPELPFWGTIAAPGEEGYNEAEQNYLIELGDKMLDTFGNHPSFVMFSLGNELWGSRNGWERSCGTTRKGTAAICTPRAATTSSIFR